MCEAIIGVLDMRRPGGACISTRGVVGNALDSRTELRAGS